MFDNSYQQHRWLGAAIGGLLVALVTWIGVFAVGRVSGVEALPLLQSILPSVRFFCSAVMTATATVLALMLTLLSLSSDVSNLKSEFYERIQRIALFDCIAFLIATVFLLLISTPLEESDAIPSFWFKWFYYIVIAAASLQGGLLVFIVLLIYATVRDLIVVVGPGDSEDHHLIRDDAGATDS